MGNDVIAAIVTGLVPSGVGVVRISGEGAIELAEPLVRIKKTRLTEAETQRVYYGFIYDGELRLDEALIFVMRAPHSFTAEDTVEIQCHGGPHIMKRILEAAVKAGARLAEPGEFSKRAFLNGRVDLSEAEAIMDLISSDNEFARKAALGQLTGSLSRKIGELRARILEETAYIEAALDDPEHISLEGYTEGLIPKLETLLSETKELVKTSDDGRRVRDGIATAILGRPNVGKSSLLNALLGEERAIVTDVAGTTRDTIEETLRLGDVLLNLADTAGIRAAGDEVERIGIERAEKKARESDLILYVLDGLEDMTEEDERILGELAGKKCIILINKTDLGMKLVPAEVEEKTGIKTICISAKTGLGLKELQGEIEEMFLFNEIRQKPLVVTNLRHKVLLENAAESLERVLDSAKAGMPEDFFSIDLMDAYRSLGLILGEEADDDLVNEIFGKFCMGK